MHKEPQSDCLTYRSMFSAKSYTTTRKIKQSDVVSVELILYGERPLEWHRLETLRLSPYHCYLYTVPVLTLQRTESQAECLHESHVTLQTDTPFPPTQIPQAFTHSLFVLTPHCVRLLLSLFAPFFNSHGWFPVYVSRATGQSAGKAVTLLADIYYPVVCLKKDKKRAKLSC